MSSRDTPTPIDTPTDEQEAQAPACVMSFNASEPSGAGGVAGDIATIAAMGAHGLPVVTSVVLRDTAERATQEALATGRPVSLEPMSSAERKIVHLVLQDHPSVVTESGGREPNRCVVVRPRDDV
jgi:O-acetyl-ADP-ribose deacetylase (regulator of RNase III)